jgi:hypothetical protein
MSSICKDGEQVVGKRKRKAKSMLSLMIFTLLTFDIKKRRRRRSGQMLSKMKMPKTTMKMVMLVRRKKKRRKIKWNISRKLYLLIASSR